MVERGRVLVIAALSVCLGLALIGDAGAARLRNTPRVEEATYDSPALGAFVGLPGPLSGGAWYADCAEAEGAGCVILDVRPRERFAHIEVQDTLGLPVHALLFAPGASVHFAVVCSQTEKPVDVSGYLELWIDVVAGTCYGEVSPSAPTTGTVIGTFFRSRPKR